jgi:hypothetical protein
MTSVPQCDVAGGSTPWILISRTSLERIAAESLTPALSGFVPYDM